MLLSLMMWPGSSAGQTPSTTECEVCLSRKVFQRCKEDALDVDGLRRRVRECQRDLDQESGGRAEAREQLVAREAVVAGLRVDVAERDRQLEQLGAELEQARRQRWWAAGVGVAGTVTTVIVLRLLLQ